MKYFAIIFAVLLIVTGFSVALTGDNAKTAAEDAGADMAAARAYYYPSAYSTVFDTITNAENDTLTVPANLLSPWGVKFVADVANVSDTTAISIIVQGSMDLTTTKTWFPIDTVAVAGAGVYTWEDSYVPEVAHRFILDGSGTQSSTYSVRAVYKTPE